jgi:polar amino acid transport system substrate-binding protein
MRIRFSIVIRAVLLGGVIALVGWGWAWAGTITLWAVEYPPYLSDTLDGGGPLARMIRESLAETEIRPEFVFAPRARCEVMVRSGRAAGALPFIPADDRKAFARFSTPLVISRTVLFYKTDKLRYFEPGRLGDLRAYDLGGVRGNAYEMRLAAAGIPLDFSPDLPGSFRKLLRGRVDLVPENDRVGWWIISQLYPRGNHTFSATERPLYVDPLCLMVSRRHDEAERLLEAVNAGLDRLRRSGRHAGILRAGNLNGP